MKLWNMASCVGAGVIVVGFVAFLYTAYQQDNASCDHTKLRVGTAESELLQICGEPSGKYRDRTVVVLNGEARMPFPDVEYMYSGNSVFVFVRDGKVRSWQYEQ